jgi:hypothetical protein
MINKGTNILKEHANKRLDFNAELKQINFLDRRVYKRVLDGKELFYPSVTTVLQYMPKGRFFEQWLKDVGSNADLIARRAGEEGTQVHNAAEALLKGEEVNWLNEYGHANYSEKVWNMICKFSEFWTEVKPELIFTEEFTFSDKFKYAGTADILCKIDGEVWLVDIKTSNSLHRSYDMQLAAYAKAIEEVKGIKVERTGILWLKSTKRGPSKKEGVYQGKGWELKPIDEIDKNFELFLLIYKLYLLDNPETNPLYSSYPTTLKL